MAQEMKEALFELTEENLETGLRGVPVGYCTTSSVDPHKGLYYCQHPVSDMADWDPLRVICLLVQGKDPSASDLEEFKRDITERSKLDPRVTDYVRALPREGHPMALWSSALLILGMFEKTGDLREDCLNVIAKVPELAAVLINHHAGWGGTQESDLSLSYMDNFTQMLQVPNADQNRLKEVFRLFNVLHYDHGGGNCSTFVGKAVASAQTDMFGSLSAAMCALAGPRHGKANQDCLDFVKQVHAELGDGADADQVEALIRQRLANKELVFGFGHAVLRVEDPRATILYAAAEAGYSDHALVNLALLLRHSGPKVLGENPKISNPYPNVDAISGILLTAAGFPYPEYYTVLFGLSRVVGIAIQIVYEMCEARNGKGVPIIRPKYFYKDRSLLK